MAAMDLEVIRRILIESKTVGVTQTVSELGKLSSAQKGVAETSETTTRATLSVERALERERRALDETYKSTRQFEQSLGNISRARAQGLISQDQEGKLLAQNVQRYNQHVQALGSVSHANDNFAKSSGLARHELVNLSRQAQDVVVSLGSGQGLGTVLLQQGTQIADVFATSTATVGSFFSQAIGWGARFITSAAGVTTATVAIGAAAAYAAFSWQQSQAEISRSLIGVGRQSGASVGDLNKTINETAATTKLSTGEARDLAIALVQTGRIGAAQIDSLTKRGRDFAKVLGLDAPEAAKLLAESFADPARGVDVLGDKLGGFTAAMRKEVKDLAAQFRFSEAQQAFERGMIPTLARAGEGMSTLSKITESTSKVFKELSAQAGRGLDRLFGNNPASEKLATAQNELGELQKTQVDRASDRSRFGIGKDTFVDKRLAQDIEKTRATIAALNEEINKINGDRLTQLGNDAVDLANKLVPDVEQANALKNAMAALNGVLGNQDALKLLSPEQVALLERARNLTVEWTGHVDRLRAAYGTVTEAAGQQIQSLQLATNLANARTAADRLSAQYALDYANAFVQVKNSADAILIATQQRALRAAEINKGLDEQLKALQQQSEVLRGASELDQVRIKAAQDYKKAVEDGGDSLKASAVAAQTIANARSSQDARAQAQSEADAARASEQRASANQAAAAAAEREQAAIDAIIAANREWARIHAFIPGFIQSSELFTRKDGTKSQFDPKGYTFKQLTPTAIIGQQIYGQGGLNEDGTPNAQGMQFYFDKLLQKSGGSFAAVAGDILGGGLLTQSALGQPAKLDTNRVNLLNRAIDVLPESQQPGYIQQEILGLQSGPASLEVAELIKQLTDKLTQLTQATQDNTSATAAMTDVLSPFYSSDPRRTHLGFRAFAQGGIMTPWGSASLKHYDNGGVTRSPSIFMTSENYKPEAIIPLQGGAVPVRMLGAANSNQQQAPVYVTQNFYGNQDRDMMRRSGFQTGQEIRRRIA